MNSKSKMLLFSLVAILLIGGDRITKNLAKAHLMNHEPISYLNGTFILEYVENTGAALSAGANLPQPYNFILLGIVPLLFLLGVLIYTFVNIKTMSRLRVISMALIFSGGIGNIIDRLLFDRHVTDFMNLGIHQLRTGIFNVADMAVTAGVMGLLISLREPKEAVALK